MTTTNKIYSPVAIGGDVVAVPVTYYGCNLLWLLEQCEHSSANNGDWFHELIRALRDGGANPKKSNVFGAELVMYSKPGVR